MDIAFVKCNLHLVSKYEKGLWQCQGRDGLDKDNDADAVQESDGDDRTFPGQGAHATRCARDWLLRR
jgi:hypothetical protein